MRLSQYFLPLYKEDQAEASIASHNLMLRAGMIRQNASGIYSWLPLGLKVLQKIQTFIRQEMAKIGVHEILMPCIQPSSVWKKSGRYDDYGKEMLKIRDRHDHELLFGPTNEELLTDIIKHSVKSYKELPTILYQIQWKFRDEIRPRFGVMRGREFLMKDAYSFDIDSKSAQLTYHKLFKAYLHIFKNMGIKVIPVKADSGPIGGNLNHEFHILAEHGESDLYYEKSFEEWDGLNTHFLQTAYAVADEKYSAGSPEISSKEIIRTKGIEVGHIFYFGTKYSKAMNAMLLDHNGKEVCLEMGSYGIGISRLVGAIVEANHDDKGIKWPPKLTPFDISVINLDGNDNGLSHVAYNLYQDLQDSGYDVLYDDRDVRAGVKFGSNDLIGTPTQIIIGARNMKNNKVEIKDRRGGRSELVSKENIKIYLEKSTAN